MLSVDKSFAHCRRVARRRARNFYYSFVLLPRPERDAMCAVYAFMRYCDDISDEPDPPQAARQAALERWRGAFEQALGGRYGRDPILPAFHRTMLDYAIPAGYFRELIEGVASDLTPVSYETFSELYRYCYRVASVVGMTCVHIFGFEKPEALRLAEKCGVAFQLTNILRDIPEDARQGRVYLPSEDLDRFGVSSDELLNGRRGRGFRSLMEYEWKRAEGYYREAAPLLELVRPGSRAALWAMIAIYHGILHRIRSLNYDVYRRRPKLSPIEKGWIVAQAARTRWLGGAPPYPA